MSLNRNIAQEKADSAKHADAWRRRRGGVWQAPAIDLERGLVVFTTGNPSPDLDGSVRPAAIRLRRNHMGDGIAGDIQDSKRQRTWITTLPRACPVPT